jgi:hypothetical protein
MKEPYGKGPAPRPSLESCAGHDNMTGEEERQKFVFVASIAHSPRPFTVVSAPAVLGPRVYAGLRDRRLPSLSLIPALRVGTHSPGRFASCTRHKRIDSANPARHIVEPGANGDGAAKLPPIHSQLPLADAPPFAPSRLCVSPP